MSGEPTGPPNGLVVRLMRRLQTALPLHSRDYVSAQTSNVFQVMAARALSQPEFIFLQAAASVATLTRRIMINKGPNLPATHPNLFINYAARPKSGKTTGQIFVEGIRKRLYNATGINNAVLTGTNAGVYKGAVLCAKRGGLPLHCPDEGITTLVSLLAPPPAGSNAIKAEVFLSSGWSGADVARAKATTENMQTEHARLTLLSMGTLTDLAAFHALCKKEYANRGLIGRFFTAYAPVYSGRCALPSPENEDDESLLAMNSTDLSTLFGDSLLSVYRKAEAPGFQGFRLSDDSLEAIEALRAQEDELQDVDEDELHWSEALKRRLLAHIQQEFRQTEMVEKWALILHVLEVVCQSINFVERTISRDELPTIISLETVECARALVQRAHDQDCYFLQVLRICTATRNRDTIYVMENVDFVLYKCLRQILLVWPGPVVTSESFIDRCSKVSVEIPFSEVAAAGQALADLGTLARETPNARISCPGIFQEKKVPRQSFRFFKTHPDIISLQLLEEAGISLADYTSRYNMDFFQIVDAQCLRKERKAEFNEWLADLPAALLPVAGDSLTEQVSSSTADQLLPFPSFPKHTKFQHESADLRFGPAARKSTRKASKRPHSPSAPQHLFRLPGEAPFSNQPP